MEAGEYGLSRGTCFFAHRLEVVAVARLMWISWCVLGAARFFFRFLFFDFSFLRTHTACCKYEAASCLIYLSTSNKYRSLIYVHTSTCILVGFTATGSLAY